MPSVTDPLASLTSSAANVLRLGVIAATALAAAILTALGLDTAGQLRILRNNPGELAWGLVLAVIGTWLMLITLALPQPKAQPAADPTDKADATPGTAIPEVVSLGPPMTAASTARRSGASFWEQVAGYVRLVGGVAFLFGTLLIVYFGARGISDRETPSLSVTARRDAESSAVLLRVEAVAPSLQSEELILLRVMGITPSDDVQLIEHCKNVKSAVNPREGLEALPNSRVLYLGESGPTTGGAAKIAFDLAVPTGQFTHVCALAFLYPRDHGDLASREVLAFARLCAVPFDPPPTPANAASSTPAPRPAC